LRTYGAATLRLFYHGQMCLAIGNKYHRQGPTGLILTTTLPNLHPENESRLFSITVRDDMQQTRSILEALEHPPGVVEMQRQA